eukprot:gb/GEZN01008339.1/.p1 GENE.gb/GEZN01008339.1/~~gb/GEZN01008339.1/.p1  ORF type:complete len:366 (-),score=77.01 gb/GEZN01008339.1/:303-1400(-)
MSGLLDIVKPGVVTGDDVMKVLAHAKANKYAIPAVNCISSSSINAVLEAAKESNAPVMIQVSNGGAVFYAGKGMSNKDQKAAVVGSVAAAIHTREMAKHYGVVCIMHSDHCAKKLLPWFDGMLAADEEYFKKHGEPLFSSHMLDLSEEPIDENIAICVKYLQRMAKINCLLEMELGLTGGEEDGVDNTGVDNASLYSQPEDVWKVYKALSAVSPRFTIAAAFGNVHGVYKAGNVKLSPEILGTSQKYVEAQLKNGVTKPVYYVFHGGSGSEKHHITTALDNGVVKMNIDTDTQWAYWEGLKNFEAKNKAYLQGQIGNPKGADKPNKKYYDPRTWLRESEVSMKKRVQESFADLRTVGKLGKSAKL